MDMETVSYLDKFKEDLHRPSMQVLSYLFEYYGEERVDYRVRDSAYNHLINSEVSYNSDIKSIKRHLEHCSTDEDYLAFFKILQTEVGAFVSYARHLYSYIIHYPEITITNESGTSHTLRDVYIEIENLTMWTQASIHINLRRGTLTEEEVTVGYSHSHVDTNTFEYFSRCCIGNGDFADILTSLGVYVFQTLDEDVRKITIFDLCHRLTQFIETESIVGGPYIRMQQVLEITGSSIGAEVQYPSPYSREIRNSYSLYSGFHNMEDGINYVYKPLLQQLLNDSNISKFFYHNGYHYFINDLTHENFIYLNNLLSPTINKINENSSRFTSYPSSFEHNIQELFIYLDNKLYTKNTDSPKIDRYRIDDFKNMFLFNFKGESIYLQIIKNTDYEEQGELKHMVSLKLVYILLTQALYLLNSQFNKKYEKENKQYTEIKSFTNCYNTSFSR